jgi:hypothetical protein
MSKFPCRDCLVKSVCKTDCKKVKHMKVFYSDGICQCCGAEVAHQCKECNVSRRHRPLHACWSINMEQDKVSLVGLDLTKEIKNV